MKRSLAWLSFCFSLGVCVVGGCGAGAPSGDQPEEAVSASGKRLPKIVNLAELPALEDYLPPLDGGRVELAGPEGWRPMSRTEKYVARYVPGDSSGSAPPRILITSDPAPAGAPASVTKAKIAAFETYIGGVIDKELGSKKDMREPVRMMVFGDRPWARYVRAGTYKSMPVDRQILQTVAGDKIYTVELQVYHGNLLDHRNAAYALAAGMKFLKTDAASGEAGGGEESLGDLLGGEGKEGDKKEAEGGQDEGGEEKSGEGGEADGS